MTYLFREFAFSSAIIFTTFFKYFFLLFELIESCANPFSNKQKIIPDLNKNIYRVCSEKLKIF